MGKDIPCISRWTNGKLRPIVPQVWSSVCLGREALEQSSRSMTDAARDLPGLEADSAAGTRADGPEALSSRLATAESVAAGRAAFKYVISLGVALLMYSSTLVL